MIKKIHDDDSDLNGVFVEYDDKKNYANICIVFTDDSHSIKYQFNNIIYITVYLKEYTRKTTKIHIKTYINKR